jgi:hypothetical protein
LIYLSDIVSKLDSGLFTILLYSGLFLIAYFIIMFVNLSTNDEFRTRVKWTRKYIFIWFFLLIFDCAIPSSTTILLIAGSQVGEQIITSQKVVGLVDPTFQLIEKKLNIGLMN